MTEQEPSNDEIRANPACRLFLDEVHPQLLANGFKQVSGTDVEITLHRYQISYDLSRMDDHGRIETRKVDIVGIPMGTVLLLVCGVIHGNEGVDLKIKIRTSEPIEVVKTRLLNDFVYKLIQVLAPTLDDMPIEIKIRILQFLSAADLINLSATNNEWNRICNSEDRIWQKLYQRDFPYSMAHQFQGTWRERYRLAFERRKEAREREEWRVRGLPGPDPLLMLPYYPMPAPPPNPFNPLHPPGPPNPLLPPQNPFMPRGPLNGGPPFGPAGGFFGL